MVVSADKMSHVELAATIEKMYKSIHLNISDFVKEKESAEYGAYQFRLNNSAIVFRVSKITPTKVGQFVTLWKREKKGPIQPYDLSDTADFFVVASIKGDKLGQFVFPKHILCEKGVVSQEGKGGKRAMRVYPPWDRTQSPQAKSTQTWQLNYFLEIPPEGEVDKQRLSSLYGL